MKNLALNKPVVFKKNDKTIKSITDGDTMTGYVFPGPPATFGTGFEIDLTKTYTINSVIIYTGGDPKDWKDHAIRDFAVYISNDKYRWDEVGVIHNMGVTNRGKGDYEYGMVNFPPVQARYVRFQITKIRQTFPYIGELVIYGTEK